MADSVQFVLDRLAHSFRQMEELGIFSSDEVASIVKKRTDHEYVLQRRQQTPGDFYNYLQYEINLEKLRILRCSKDMQVQARKIKKREDGGKKGVEKAMSDLKNRQNAIRNLQASSVRHISTVFERGIRRFPDEIDLVTDYIAFLKDELTPAAVSNGKGHEKYLVVANKTNSSALSEVFGRALSRHPKNESLWIMAAMHEVETNNNVHAARALLQRALRANKASNSLWKQYFELELWNALKLIARRKIITKPKINSKGNVVDEEEEPSKAKKVTSKENDEEDDEENYEESLLSGAPLVVFKHAVKAVDEVDFALTLLNLIRASLEPEHTTNSINANSTSFYGQCYNCTLENFKTQDTRSEADVQKRMLNLWGGLMRAVSSSEEEQESKDNDSDDDDDDDDDDKEKEEVDGGSSRKRKSAKAVHVTNHIPSIINKVELFTKVLRDANSYAESWSSADKENLMSAAQVELTSILQHASRKIHTSISRGTLLLPPSAGSAKKSRRGSGKAFETESEANEQVSFLCSIINALIGMILSIQSSSAATLACTAEDIARKVPNAVSSFALSLQVSRLQTLLGQAGTTDTSLDSNWLLSQRTADALLTLVNNKVTTSNLDDAVDSYARLWTAVSAGPTALEVAVALAPFLSVLVRTSNGIECFIEVVGMISAEGNSKHIEVCGKGFAAALVSRACQSNYRGELCAAYIQWVWEQQERKQQLQQQHSPTKLTLARRKNALLEATLRTVHQFVSTQILAVPMLVAGGGMLEYFSAALEHAYSIWCQMYGISNSDEGTSATGVADGTGSTKLLALIRTLGDSALKLSSGGEERTKRDRIWNIRENVELHSHHHKEASRIRWRRERD